MVPYRWFIYLIEKSGMMIVFALYDLTMYALQQVMTLRLRTNDVHTEKCFRAQVAPVRAKLIVESIYLCTVLAFSFGKRCH